MTKFGIIDDDGNNFTVERDIPQEAIRNCPHFIMWPEHYRRDNTCRCNDVTHRVMHEWGYQWHEERKLWV